MVRPGMNVTAEALIESCRASLARFKAPKEIRFVAKLPRNSVGKILRRALRDGTS